MNAPLKRARFARKSPYDDLALVGLYVLIDETSAPGERGALSAIARDRLRALFPQGKAGVGSVELENGLIFDVDLNDVFGAEFFVGHCNEAKLLDAVVAALPENATVIDVGANFGLYAVHAASLGARVLAFEPAPSAAALLERNATQNGFSNLITVDRRAVAEGPGRTLFKVAADGSFSGLSETGRSALLESIEVDMVGLDAAAAEFGAARVDLLKIDVEGFEGAVLAGAHALIDANPDLIILFEHSWKNLTPASDALVRKEISRLLDSGHEVYAVAGGPPVRIETVDALNARFNGTMLTLRSGAPGAAHLLSILREGVSRSASRELVAAGELLAAQVSDRRDQLARADKAEARLAQSANEKEALVTMLQSLKARMTDSDARQTQLNQRINDWVGFVEKLQAEVAQQSARAQNAEARLARIADEKDALLSMLQALKGRVADSETRHVQLNERVSSWVDYLKNWQAQISNEAATERQAAQNQGERLGAVGRQVEDVVALVENLRANAEEFAEKANAFGDQRQRLDALENQLAQSTVDRELQREILKRLSADVAALSLRRR